MSREYFNNCCEVGNAREVASMIMQRLGSAFYSEGLRYACRGSQIKVVYLLLAHGFNELDEGIMGACEAGNVEMLSIMLSEASSSNKSDVIWNAGLYGSCLGGHEVFAHLMISKGANDWHRALKGACKGDHLELVKFLAPKVLAEGRGLYIYEILVKGSETEKYILHYNKTGKLPE